MISEFKDSNGSTADEFHHHSSLLLTTPTVDPPSHTDGEIIDGDTSDSPRRIIETANSDEDYNTNDGVGNSTDDDNDYDDCDDDVSDLEEFLHSLNSNHSKKLHPSTHLSVHDACLEIVKISQELNLNKLQINRLLRGIRSLLPIDNKLPRTISGLFKIVGKNLHA